MSEQKRSDFADEFIRGAKDCKAGIPHKTGTTEAYDRGYSAQYQHEQNMTALSEKRK